MRKRFFIKTFGCQMNKSDSLLLAKLMSDQGFEQVDESESADVYIVNTCTVREHAANRALTHISGLRKWREASNRILAVVGCLAKSNADDICRRLNFVDLLLGPDSYRSISEYVIQLMETKGRIIDTKLSAETYCGIYHSPTNVADFVSIMRGCDNYCSYCVVPYVRGRARSRTYEDIRDEIIHLTERGVKDITLLGQNVNEYRYGSLDFAGLLKSLAGITGVFRIRFLTSHPKDFSKETVQVVKDHREICEWFHLPLQSGSNRILQLMNRKYTKEQYLALVKHIRSEIPEATITTDVIAGFPTETEEEFTETLNILREIRFEDAYLYRYSERAGTRASAIKPLDEPVIKRRLSDLIKVQKEIVKEKTAEMIGKEYEILFEGEARGDSSRGKTRGNKDIVVNGRFKPGEARKVIIKDIRGHTPVGELIDA